MEHKNFLSSYQFKADRTQGIVESIVAVFGNDDFGNDIIHPGAFAATIQPDRLKKIRVLDQHQTDSIMRVIGKPLELKEIPRDQLPIDLLLKYPAATGGLFARTQFLLDTPEGAGAFARIVGGVIDGYSIGYDAISADYSSIVGSNGQKKTIRNLRTIKLYEYSPCLFPMNEATATISAKSVTASDRRLLVQLIERESAETRRLAADLERLLAEDERATAEARARDRAVLFDRDLTRLALLKQ